MNLAIETEFRHNLSELDTFINYICPADYIQADLELEEIRRAELAVKNQLKEE